MFGGAGLPCLRSTAGMLSQVHVPSVRTKSSTPPVEKGAGDILEAIGQPFERSIAIAALFGRARWRYLRIHVVAESATALRAAAKIFMSASRMASLARGADRPRGEHTA